MDVVQITDRIKAQLPHDASCAGCHRALRVGQWVLRDTLRSANYADARRYIHVNPCLRTLVEATPVVDDDEATNPDTRLDRHRRQHEAAIAS